MTLRLRQLWDYLRASYWFLPGLMAIAGAILVPLVLFVEEAFPLYTGYVVRVIDETGNGGARSILATIAASAIGTASVVFSVTIVALSLTSNQFGPRLLKNFLGQGNAQFTLGIFIATFIFCLFGLAFIPDDGSPVAFPHLLLLVGLFGGAMSFVVLIDYIHQTTIFIQAPHVIAEASTALIGTFKRLPSRNGMTGVPPRQGTEEVVGVLRTPVSSAGWGYIQAIDYGELMALAARWNACIEVVTRPGGFVVVGQQLAVIAGAGLASDQDMEAVRDRFVLGKEKTAIQDMEFAIEQLVQIAVRALSPGVNDPDTATHCIDHLGAALSVAAGRELPAEKRYDDDGVCRLRVRNLTYGKLLDASFNQIRQYGAGDASVAIRLMRMMVELAKLDLPDDFPAALLRHARLLNDERGRLSHVDDAAEVEAGYREIESVFDQKRGGMRP